MKYLIGIFAAKGYVLESMSIDTIGGHDYLQFSLFPIEKTVIPINEGGVILFSCAFLRETRLRLKIAQATKGMEESVKPGKRMAVTGLIVHEADDYNPPLDPKSTYCLVSECKDILY